MAKKDLPEPEVEDCDLEEIARLIREGFTSGNLSNEEKNIYWEIKINVWRD